MPHGVYNQRGDMILSTESEIAAFYYAMQRQREGNLTTILLDGVAEIMFAPVVRAGARAETAAEYQARISSVVKEEMERKPGTIARLFGPKI